MKKKAKDLNAELDARLTKAGIPHYSEPIYRVNVAQFYKALKKAKKSRGDHGWMVDVDEKQAYSKMKLYLSRDGKAGMAIGKDGNVHSLFSASRAAGGKKNALGSLIPFAVEHGGKKLDCYGAGLQNMYGRYGAKATGKVKFDGSFNEDWMALPDDHPDKVSPPDYVVAMTLPKSVGGIIRNYDSEKVVDMKRVKEYKDKDGKYGYDRMLEARDEILSGKIQKLMPGIG